MESNVAATRREGIGKKPGKFETGHSPIHGSIRSCTRSLSTGDRDRADIIAEHFTKERNASALVPVAKELDDRTHRMDPIEIQTLSPEAKSILGLYADFVQAKRGGLLNGGLSEGVREVPAKRDAEA